MLQHLGAYTIDADGLSQQATAPGAPAYKPVVEAFGQVILNPDKTINRKALANIVFSNPALMEKLEGVVHPIVGGAINTLVQRSTKPIIVIEAIKLLEGDLMNAIDAIWVVNAKPQSQYLRLVSKRKMTEEEAKQRILGQNPQAIKLKAASVVIDNDGNIEETWKQVQSQWQKVPQPSAPAPMPPPAPAQPASPTKPAAPATPSATPAPAPKPAPTASAPAKAAPAIDTSGVTVKRGMPSNAETIAEFMNKRDGRNVSRVDIMMAFGQKSYLLAETQDGVTAAIVGWQVENLITRVDDLLLDPAAPVASVVYALVHSIEEASQELQSEVSFIFLPSAVGDDIKQPILQSGYELTTIKDIKVPAWREAVQEMVTDGIQILSKKLRQDRVLKPI
jgi:dephospho-CoA kinase